MEESMAAAQPSETDHTSESSPQREAILRAMHQAIEDRDIKRVEEYLDKVPELRLWLEPTRDQSALCKAVQEKAFHIYGLLLSRKCTLKKDEECYGGLNDVERAEIRRQKFFSTELTDSYVYYLKSKSRSQTQCEDFDEKLARMYEKLVSVNLIRTIMKVVATEPHLDILFDYERESVQYITGSCRTDYLGLTFSEERRVCIGGNMEETKVWGTFAHEMCHLALYLVYRNSGKPYFCYDAEREHEYQTMLANIKKKQTELHVVIQRAFIQHEEQELIVRVPDILAQYSNSGDGARILEKDAPGLHGYFEQVVVPDMLEYIADTCPGQDTEKIREENARLQKAFNRGNLKVAFEVPLKRQDLEAAPLLFLTGPDLGLLEVMVHDAVQSTGRSYLFFETANWDTTLKSTLRQNKCTFILVTVSPRKDFRYMLEDLSEICCVTGAKTILLAEGDGTKEDVQQDLLKNVPKDTFFAKNCDVRNLSEARLERVTLSCKEELWNRSRMHLQGAYVAKCRDVVNIDIFLRYMDAATFLQISDSKIIDAGPLLPELEKCVRKCYVERFCKRATKVDLKNYKFRTEDEAFAFLGCSERNALMFLPTGSRVHKFDKTSKFENFVLLKRDADFVVLAEDVHYKNKVVHLLEFNSRDETLRWVKSNGRLSHLPMTGQDTHKFMSVLNNKEKVVVVCGTPGMGKSALASRLCMEIKIRDKKAWVLHVDLPQKVPMNVKTLSPTLRHLADLCGVKKDCLEFALFQQSVNNARPFKVFVVLDALDEMNEGSRKYILDLAKLLIQTKVCKLFIFTRTVFKTEVEDAMHTVSYELAPFSQSDQETFLRKYKEQAAVDHERSENRNADTSRKFHDLYLSIKDKSIFETPLLLRMVAEMENGQITDTDYSSLLEQVDLSPGRSVYATDVYRMFVEYKYLVYRMKKKDDFRLCAVQEADDVLRSSFNNDHGVLAIGSLFPNDVWGGLLNDDTKKLGHHGRLIKDVAQNRLKQGFVNGLNNDIPVFVHRTFAEYFAAHYILETVKDAGDADYLNRTLSLYIITHYAGVMLFLDGLASVSLPLHTAIINKDASYFENHVIGPGELSAVDELGRTPLHLAAMYADRNTFVKLVAGNALAKYDIFGKTPFTYAHLSYTRSTDGNLYKGENGKCIPRELTESEKLDARHKIDILSARFTERAVQLTDEILREPGTRQQKVFFVERNIAEAVLNDLRGSLDIYLAYFVPKKKSETMDKAILEQLERRMQRSVQYAATGDLDSLTYKYHRTLAFYAKSTAVCEMLLPYCDMGIVDDYGDTMLHHSARNGNVEVVTFHLAHSSVNVRNRGHLTPLHVAVQAGHADIVRLLLPYYSSVNISTVKEEPPICLCAEQGRLDILRLLLLRSQLSVGDDYTATPLHYASIFGRKEAVMFLLPHLSSDLIKLDVTLAYTIHEPLATAMCLIPHCVFNCPYDCDEAEEDVCPMCCSLVAVQALFPYWKTDDEEHLLRMFTYHFTHIRVPKQLHCAKLFLLHSNVNATDKHSNTTLHIIAEKRLVDKGNAEEDVQYAKLLLPHSDVRARNKEGKTPLQLAEKSENNPALTSLLRRWTGAIGNEDADDV